MVWSPLRGTWDSICEREHQINVAVLTFIPLVFIAYLHLCRLSSTCPPLSVQIKVLSTHIIARRTPAWAHIFTCPSPLQPTADPWRSSTPTLIPSVTPMHTSPLPCCSHLCPVQPSPAALPLLISSYNIPVPLLECCWAAKRNDTKKTDRHRKRKWRKWIMTPRSCVKHLPKQC